MGGRGAAAQRRAVCRSPIAPIRTHLGKLLADDRLCEPATQALLAIGGAEAAGAMREALGGAKGKRRAKKN